MTLLNAKSDVDAIAALSPRAVAGYLESKGWLRHSAYGEYGAVFRRSIDNRHEEVLISTTQETHDYVRAMSAFILDLAQIEDRSPFDIIADLTVAPYDVIRVQVIDADSIGSVPLSVGVELHEQARCMAAAAANAAAAPEPRPFWQGRPLQKVDSYLNALRLGQSRRGSFVLSLLSPWDFSPQNEAPTVFTEVPFGRRVTKTLARALNATRVAISRSVNEDIGKSFGNAVSHGVSVNLCETLAALARDGEGVSISVNWSLTKPEDHVATLTLRREDAQTLREASQMLAKAAPLPEVTIEGPILQITNDLRTFDGSVIVHAFVNGGMKKVKVNFSEHDRERVFNAAQQKLVISVVGDLISRGKRLRLELMNPHNLTILESAEDDANEEQADTFSV